MVGSGAGNVVGHGDGSGHWDNGAAARALVRAKDATRRLSLLYDNAREAAGMTANALREEAVRALRRLDGEAATAVARNHGNNSDHWDNGVPSSSWTLPAGSCPCTT